MVPMFDSLWAHAENWEILMQNTLFALLLLASAGVRADCPSELLPREALLQLKSQAFMLSDEERRFETAEALVACLASPDPQLRDGVAYSGLSTWFREKKFTELQLRALQVSLNAMLQAEDTEGFARPFAALMLSELARTDRVSPWMTSEERLSMVNQAIAYMKSISDYRGFDSETGWRHGVAHASDWILQLTVNTLVDAPQVLALTDAVALQVLADNRHAYVFGESGRLARPVLFAARRGVRTEAEWQAWLKPITEGMADPTKAYQDAEWLVKRHNLVAFLQVLYLESDISEGDDLQALKAAVLASLKNVP